MLWSEGLFGICKYSLCSLHGFIWSFIVVVTIVFLDHQVIAPQSASGVVLDSPEACKLLSAVAIALTNCSRWVFESKILDIRVTWWFTGLHCSTTFYVFLFGSMENISLVSLLKQNCNFNRFSMRAFRKLMTNFCCFRI